MLRSSARNLLLVVVSQVLFSTRALAQHGAEPDLSLLWIFFAIIFAIYFIPSIVAFGRGHPSRWLIVIVNLMAGWTFIAWVFALVWALNKLHQPPSGSPGGASGMNLFVNDEKRVRLIEKRDATVELERLKKLLESGAIDESEFQQLKLRILKSALG